MPFALSLPRAPACPSGLTRIRPVDPPPARLGPGLPVRVNRRFPPRPKTRPIVHFCAAFAPFCPFSTPFRAISQIQLVLIQIQNGSKK